jgi:hypothetical protein
MPMMDTDAEEAEEAEEIIMDLLEHAVGAASKAAYDAAYVTALKTARSLLKSTNANIALSALADMIAVFDPVRAEDENDEPGDDEPEAKPFSLPEPPLGTA